MSSDVCKHCTEAACLDVCPTGALFRTEFDTVVVQEDVCNGCGYCVPACPFGVHRPARGATGAPRSARSATTGSKDGLEPACAKACPTDSIQFGAARRAARARRRRGSSDAARRRAWPSAQLYGARPGRRRRRRRRVLPAARRARGLRAAARPGRHHARPAGDVAAAGARGAARWRGVGGRRSRGAAVSAARELRMVERASRAPTTAGR